MHFKRQILAVLMTFMVVFWYANLEAKALTYDPNVDYTALMIKMAAKGDRESLYAGKVFEKLRNEKIDCMGLRQYKKTDFFTRCSKASDIKLALDLAQNGWTMEDLDWMARIINAEAGCDWMPDWVPRAVGSVVLNRVKDKRFPNTIKGVIFQPGKYGPIYNGMIWQTPTAKSRNNAIYILTKGKTLPDGVIGQNGVGYGKIYSTYYDWVLGTTIYFHY